MDRSSTESKVSACLTTLLEVGLESAQHALALRLNGPRLNKVEGEVVIA
jgi:hypothetical protein